MAKGVGRADGAARGRVVELAYGIGDRVLVGGETEGQVIGVGVYGRELRVLYQVAWWSGNTRYEQWVCGLELKRPAGEKGMGFRLAMPVVV